MADVFLPAGSAQGKPAVEDVAFLVGGTYTVAIVTPPEPTDLYNPRNYQDDQGQYYVVSIIPPDGHLRYRRCDFSTPLGGYNVDIEMPGVTGASYPVVTVEPTTRAVLVLWTGTGPHVYEALSNDDGESWEVPIVAFSGGSKPAIWVGVDSSIMRGAVVGTHIELSYQAPGDMAPSAPFTMKDQTGATILVKNDTFGLSQETNDSTLRWTAELSITGETATSTWESTDDGESWKRVV